MKLTSGIALFAMSVSLCGAAPAGEAASSGAGFVRKLQAGEKQTVVYYGTSLTAAGAWTRLLTNRLKETFPDQIVAHNSGGPGCHSGWGVDNLQQRVIALKPHVVFIEFSINDAVARFNLSPERAKANLEKMIDRVQTALPGCEVILQIMNPVIDKPEGDSGWRPTLAECQQNYRDVAAERGLLLIDHMPAWSRLLETDEKTFRTYIPDGVHPVEAGWSAIVMPELLRRIGL
jgi:acyl-CoA thioesterase I